MTAWTVRLAISAANSSSSRYSEVNGTKSGPDDASRRSAGNRSRSVGTLEPRPASERSQPSSSPTFHRSAQSARAAPDQLLDGSPAATCRTSRGKSSGPPGVGSAHTSSSRKSRAISWMRQGLEVCAVFGSLIRGPPSLVSSLPRNPPPTYTKNPGDPVLLSRAFGGLPRTRRRRTSPDPSRRGRTQRCLRSRPSARPSRPILWQSRLLLSVPDSPGIRQGGRAYAGRSTAKSRVSDCLFTQELFPTDAAVPVLGARQRAAAHGTSRLAGQRELQELLPHSRHLQVGTCRLAYEPHLWPADVRYAPCRRTESDLDHPVGYLPGVYGLAHEPFGHRHHGQPGQGPDRHKDQIVELGGPQDGVQDR